MRRVLWHLAFLLLMGGGFGNAATHEVSVPMEEAWEAVTQVAAKYGIRKMDPKKRILETNWIEDYIRRERPLLPFKKTRGLKLAETFSRRTRLRVRLEPSPLNNVRFTIQGQFQQKGMGASYSGWKRVKPGLEDYQIERDFFYEILDQLESHKREIQQSSAS